ncbi:WXG100 family type VII secretion target [Mycobacteroides abscessus]|uniref:WXG100 family type VII secretion target n=1 Tax=Mycobacteroides abscessus TaxID=36809 RepID=UPI0011C49507|nr:hypothetical protein [Mycobacteroides abscessus]
MGPLTIADTLRWNPEAVRGVESAINKHGATAQEISDALYKLPLFQSWEGESGSAAKESLDKLSRYLVAHADEMEALGKALGKAAVEIENVRKELRDVLNRADEYGMDIDPVSGAVKPTAAANIGLPATTIALRMSELQNDIKNVLAHAESVDQALASAISGSGTTTPTAKHGDSGTLDLAARLKGLTGDKPPVTTPANTLPAAAAAAPGALDPNAPKNGSVVPEQKPVVDPKTLGSLAGTTNFIEANRKPEAKPADKPAPQSKGFLDGWVDAAKQKAEGIVEHAGDLVGLHGSEKAKDAWIDVGVGVATDALKHSIPGGDTPSAMDQTIDAYNKVQDAKAHGGSSASLAGAGVFDMQAKGAEASAAIATGGAGRFLERGLVEGAIGAEGRAALSEGVPTLDSALHSGVKGMLDNALHGHVETPATPHVETPATPHTPHAEPPPPAHIDTPQPEHHVPVAPDHPAPSGGLPHSPEQILDDARASHRAERDQMDWNRGEQNLHDIAQQHGVHPDELPRTPQYDIDSPQYTDKHDATHSGEIDRQTSLWEHGFNTQSVQQTLDNMDNARPPSTSLRDELRVDLKDFGMKQLMDAGYGPAEAERLAKDYASQQFPAGSGTIPQPVIHNPDIKMGGPPNALTYGDWQVNNALGTLTKQEMDSFRAWLETQPPDAIVNVRLRDR